MRREKSERTLADAYQIASEYGGNLTVRQLYYQLVARGHIANSQESYKRLVSLLGEARLAGDFPFEWLLDRTREARPGRFKGNQIDVETALDSAADDLRRAPESWLWRDRWYGQPTHVSVWVEKEALAGVFERPCEALGVAWFVLRGYSSLSALSEWVDHASEAYRDGEGIEEAVVLYFGDHDPDGWEIPRSAERNIEAIASVRGIDLTFSKRGRDGPRTSLPRSAEPAERSGGCPGQRAQARSRAPSDPDAHHEVRGQRHSQHRRGHPKRRDHRCP